MDEARDAVDKILSSVEEELWERRRLLGSNWLKDNSTVMLAEFEHDITVLNHFLNDLSYKKKGIKEQAMWRANRIAARAGVMAHKIGEEIDEIDKEPPISAEDIKSEILRVMALQTIACEELVVILPDKVNAGEVFIRGYMFANGEWIPVKQTYGFTNLDLKDAASDADSLREIAKWMVGGLASGQNIGGRGDSLNVD